jgi:hypothetical protein
MHVGSTGRARPTTSRAEHFLDRDIDLPNTAVAAGSQRDSPLVRMPPERSCTGSGRTSPLTLIAASTNSI